MLTITLVVLAFVIGKYFNSMVDTIVNTLTSNLPVTSLYGLNLRSDGTLPQPCANAECLILDGGMWHNVHLTGYALGLMSTHDHVRVMSRATEYTSDSFQPIPRKGVSTRARTIGSKYVVGVPVWRMSEVTL